MDKRYGIARTLVEDIRAVVLSAWLTVWVNVAVLVLKFASPE